MTVNDRPFHSMEAYRRSRVTPGVSSTIATRLPIKRLKSVDLPTLGRPTTATSGLDISKPRRNFGFWILDWRTVQLARVTPAPRRERAGLLCLLNVRATAFCLPPSAYCLLPSAYRLLPTAYCLLPTAYCLLPTAFCLLPTPYSPPLPRLSPRYTVCHLRRGSHRRRPAACRARTRTLYRLLLSR